MFLSRMCRPTATFEQPDSQARALLPQELDKPPQRHVTAPHFWKGNVKTSLSLSLSLSSATRKLLITITESHDEEEHDLKL